MVDIRLAQKDDLPRQKELWKTCFGDEDDYIDFYFDNKYKEKQTAVLLWDEEIVAMATMIPAALVMENNKRFDLSMLYAIATHPGFQGKGLSTQIMDFCHAYLEGQNQDMSILVPAQESLFDFYEKRGYRDGFYIREVTLTRDQIMGLQGSKEGATITPTPPSSYNTIRRDQLEGKVYIDYANEEIAYQKQLCQKYGGDLYGLEVGETRGCAVVEVMSETEVLIKEILMPDHLVKEGIRQIARVLPAQKYRVRLPAGLGAHLGGQVRHFGMIKGFKEKNIIPLDARGYLGIAYD